MVEQPVTDVIASVRVNDVLALAMHSSRILGFRKRDGRLSPAAPAQPASEADLVPEATPWMWARLIRKTYAVDPLLCLRCAATIWKVTRAPKSAFLPSRARRR